MLTGGSLTSIGTTFFPFILNDAETGEQMRIVLYAIVVPKLFMGMFIGDSVQFLESRVFSPSGTVYTFEFGRGGVHKVDGIPVHYTTT